MNREEGSLLLAAFCAALGFGALIPVLPVYLAAAGASLPWHTGALPFVFLLVASVSAPLWGRLSDRIPRRRVLLGGLVIAAGAGLPFVAQHSVSTLYMYQALAGLSFGAVAPVALAMLYETTPAAAGGRGVAWFNGALLAGYFVGPAAGGWAAALASEVAPHRVVILAISFHALLVLIALRLVAQASHGRPFASAEKTGTLSSRPATANASIATALLAAFMIGAFEIGAALYARSPLHFGPGDVASLFMACSAAMIAIQIAVLPRLGPDAPRIYMAWACVAVSAVLLALIVFAQAHAALFAVAASQGAALGLAVGLVSFETAARGGATRGLLLGYQNAAMNAGQAVGSAAGTAAFVALGGAGLSLVGALVLLAGALFSGVYAVSHQGR